MRYAVISDLHANLTALESVLADAETLGVDEIVCLGDVVGYGPQPAEVLSRVRSRCSVTLAGNHDDAVSGRLDPADFIDLAADAVTRHRGMLEPDAIAWLKQLPRVCRFGSAAAAHGDFADPPKFYYVRDDEDARANFEAVSDQLLFVGHTHEPCIFLTGQSGRIYRLEPQDFTVETGKRYIVNPGSVGYPREQNGECRSSYVIYDSGTGDVRYRFLPFAVSGMLQRGVDPRRSRHRAVVAGIAALALSAVAGLWFLAPRAAENVSPVVTNVTVVAERPGLEFTRKSLTLPASAGRVSANLRLEKGSCPVELRIVFRNANGGEVGTIVRTVKGSARGREKIPSGSVSADFVIRRLNADDRPALREFAPVAVN